MTAKPQKEHQWLEKLIGDWTCEMEASMGPDKPPMKSKATESVRSLAGLWIVAEGQTEMAEGQPEPEGCGPGTTLLTLGYDPQKGHYVGTWVGSMMTQLWVYKGTLDAGGTVLTLATEGPDMEDPAKTMPYKDVIEMKSDDHRILTSHMLMPDGKWVQFMTAHYRRKK